MSTPLMKRKRKTAGGVDSPKRRLSSSSEAASVSSEEPSHSSKMDLNIHSLQSTEASTSPSVLSVKSDRSKAIIINFKPEPKGLLKTEGSTPSVLSMASDRSMYTPMTFGPEPKGPQKRLCCVCERTFDDSPVFFACEHVACTPCVIITADDPQADQFHCTVCETYQRLAPNQTLKLLTRNREIFGKIQRHKKEMHRKFSIMSEGDGDETIPLKNIYTSLSIKFGNNVILEEDNLRQMIQRKDSKEIQVELSSLFVSSSTKPSRTILTNGAAGIGKSFSVQNFIVDWSEGTSNQHVHFVFNLSFRELNLIKEDISFLQLLKMFHPAVSDLNPQDLDLTKVIVILDGFDESRFHLDFSDSQKLSSVQEPASVPKLVMNLIKGNLLPNTQLWITSRPAASYLIPGEFIHKVTEIQGFNDQQKEEYFQKRFSNKPDIAKMVISYIQSSQTLDLLCQIPVFCWMCSVLLEEVFGGEEQTEAPQTLTEMMGLFLFVQTKRSSRKYDQNPERERTRLLKAKRGFLLKLGQLAFIHLLDNSLIFYYEDLQQCGLDPEEATVNSGFFNSVLRQDQLFSRQKVFYFVHLTIQEFFAALYVCDCFTNNKDWAPELSRFLGLDLTDSSARPPVFELLKMVVGKVLERNSVHLYFFQRFLLGLMVESNQKCVRGLLVPVKSGQDETVRNMLGHLKAIRRKTVSPDACINLFQTMVEMGDSKISEDIQEYLKNEGRARIALTPLHCSALAFTIQSSRSVLEELDLKSYNTSEEGRRRLIPAVRSSKKANLSECRVSEALLQPLSLALSVPHSSLRDLDLSNSDLGDSGVKLLSEGLRSPVCKLKILSLSGCLVTEVGCLVSALKLNPTHLKELDLSYNHLEASGETSLKNLKSDPQYNLSHLQLNLSHGGRNRMIPGPEKYWCDLSWATKQAHAGLQFSVDHREVSRSDETPDRVLVWGGRGLSGRFYWEIEASEPFSAGVAYQSKELEETELRLGENKTSWTFVCSEDGCYAFHNNQRFPVPSAHCWRSSRLAVLLDHPAGVLSFYRVSTDSRTTLHTFREKFTKDLFPAAELKKTSFAKFYHEATKSEEHET